MLVEEDAVRGLKVNDYYMEKNGVSDFSCLFVNFEFRFVLSFEFGFVTSDTFSCLYYLKKFDDLL